MWLARLLVTKEWSLGVSPATQRETVRSCLIRSLSLTLSFCLSLSLTHMLAHKHTHKWVLRVHFKVVYACINTFLCHSSWSMHPSPMPKQRKRSSMSSKERESLMQIYWQAEADRALYRDSLAEWDRQRKSFMFTATPTGVPTVIMRGGWSSSWMEFNAAVGQTRRSLYIWLWLIW